MDSQHILVVGDVINDIMVRPLAEVTENSDTRSQIVMTPGGSAANMACWLGYLGADVSFVGKVGEADASFHREFLESFGVVPVLSVDMEHPTGTIAVIVDEQGRRTMFTDKGANLHLAFSDISEGAIENAAVVHLSGYSFFENPLREVGMEILKRAMVAGSAVSIDPSSSAFLLEVGPQNFLEWTKGAHYAFPNYDEAVALTGTKDPLEAARILGKYWDVVVVTMDADGCVVAGPSLSPQLIAIAKEAALDTTGAGDSFSAGFLSEILRAVEAGECPRNPTEKTLRDAVRVGAATAAKAVTKLGARPPRS